MSLFSPPKRKYNHNDLSHSSRYSTPSIRTGRTYLEGSCARSDNKETHVNNYKRAKKANEISRSPISCDEGIDGKMGRVPQIQIMIMRITSRKWVQVFEHCGSKPLSFFLCTYTAHHQNQNGTYLAAEKARVITM